MRRSWLCGVDFADQTERVLETAFEELACAGGGKLVVVHVLPTPTPPSYGFAIPSATISVYERLHQESIAHAARTLAEKMAPLMEAHPDVEVKELVRTGEAAEELLTAAEEEGAQRIIVGSVRKSGLQRLLLGSVAERVLRLAHVPVLVIK